MPDLLRAYAVLDTKADSGDAGTITGVAVTPTLDRQGHVFELAGATFTNPIPLLLHHDTERPIGSAVLSKRADAIVFTASLPSLAEAGPLADRIRDVLQQVRAGLIRGASIGFRVLDDGVEFVKGGGLRIVKSEICELSLVTIPANRDATILSVKSFDTGGPSDPPAPAVPGSGLPTVRAVKAAPAMTIAEQMTQWSNTRAPKAARMADLMKTAADTNVTLDAEGVKEYDALKLEVQSIDGHLGRLREMESLNAAAAQPVAAVTAAAPIQQPTPVIQVRSNLPPGTAFVRAACAIMVCKGNMHEAAEYARARWDRETPEVALYLKAAVAAGTSTDATWAGPLVNPNIAQDFIELLRPATILGKIPNWRKVPFNTKVPSQSAGGTYGWVGEAKPKPITKLAFTSDTLATSKVAGIIVLTEELVRLSSPSAEELTRRDMIAGIAQFLDAQLIDPAVAAVAGVNPASITNGAGTAVATVDPLADVLKILGTFATANIPIAGAAPIMSETNAMALAFRRGAGGLRTFSPMTPTGGTIEGVQVVASGAAGGNIIGVQPSYVLLADEGGVTIDVSREASLQMDSAPMSPADATVVMVSLWQNNLVGLRAERFINWKRVNAAACYYLTAAAYPAPSSFGNGNGAEASGGPQREGRPNGG